MMTFNTDGLDASILAPAFAAGVLVLLTHVILGREVLQRGIIFIDLAIAQFAGLGIIFADTLGIEAHGWLMQAIALASALAGALALGAAEKYFAKQQEALIGISFVLASTGSILLLASNPHGGEHLKDLLVGQILWVEWHELVLPLVCSIAVVMLWFVNPALFRRRWFYLLFAICITLSVQLVGVYLVFASLIIPALATLHYSGKRAVILAFAIGLAGYLSGLVLSALLDLPSGALIVWSLALCAVLFSVVVRSR